MVRPKHILYSKLALPWEYGLKWLHIGVEHNARTYILEQFDSWITAKMKARMAVFRRVRSLLAFYPFTFSFRERSRLLGGYIGQTHSLQLLCPKHILYSKLALPWEYGLKWLHIGVEHNARTYILEQFDSWITAKMKARMAVFRRVRSLLAFYILIPRTK